MVLIDAGERMLNLTRYIKTKSELLVHEEHAATDNPGTQEADMSISFNLIYLQFNA